MSWVQHITVASIVQKEDKFLFVEEYVKKISYKSASWTSRRKRIPSRSLHKRDLGRNWLSS